MTVTLKIGATPLSRVKVVKRAILIQKLSTAIASSIHVDTNKILLNNKEIEVLDTVPDHYHNCTTLLLSQNQIKSLHGLHQFSQLKNLSLSHNCIDDYEELKNIKGDELTSLSLEGNPIHNHPNYRCIILGLFPSLKSLDSKIVTKAERACIGKNTKHRD